jgi:hypothetical protein
MRRWLIPLVVLIVFASACGGGDDVYFVPTSESTARIVYESPTRQALDAWVRALPKSGDALLAWYDFRRGTITLYVNGDTARVRHSRVRMLCRRLAHTLPIGLAKHVVLAAGLYWPGHRLASIRAGGACHMGPSR